MPVVSLAAGSSGANFCFFITGASFPPALRLLSLKDRFSPMVGADVLGEQMVSVAMLKDRPLS
jgi:hypothetical protein